MHLIFKQARYDKIYRTNRRKVREKSKMFCTKHFIFCTNSKKTSRGFFRQTQRLSSCSDLSIKTPFTSSHANMQGCEGREGQKQVLFYLFRPIHQSIILQFIVNLQIFAVENPVASVPIERN